MRRDSVADFNAQKIRLQGSNRMQEGNIFAYATREPGH